MRSLNYTLTPPILVLYLLAAASLAVYTSRSQVFPIALKADTVIQKPFPLLRRDIRTHIFYNPAHSHRLRLTTFASLIPFRSASSALLQLYAELLSNASGPWLSLPAAAYFTARCGNIYIDFEASQPYRIPWSFVAEFAEKMMEATARGFTGRFEGEYRHLESGAVIRVALRVVLIAAAA